MTGRGIRAGAAALALIVLTGPLLGACSQSDSYTQVDSGDDGRGVSLPTTSIVQGTLPPRATTTTSAPTALPAATTADGALVSMIGQLAGNPGIIAAVGQLTSADPISIASLFELDPGLVAQLDLTLREVQGLAAIAAGFVGTVDPAAIAAAVTGSAVSGVTGALDLTVLRDIVELAGSFDSLALAAINGISQQLIGAIVATLDSAMDKVDPFLLTLLTALLDRLDPRGLGALTAQNPATTPLLAVFAGAVLRSTPGLSDQIRPQLSGDAQLLTLMDRLVDVGSAIPASDAAAIAVAGSELTPEALTSLAQLMSTYDDPSVRRLFDQIAA